MKGTGDYNSKLAQCSCHAVVWAGTRLILGVLAWSESLSKCSFALVRTVELSRESHDQTVQQSLELGSRVGTAP